MRVLLTLIAVLAISASALAINGANSGVVDDFESYLDDADLGLNWRGGLPWGPPETQTTITLNYSNPLDQYMDIALTAFGGGDNMISLNTTIQDVWGGPLSTHITFKLKGNSSNSAAWGMQMWLDGAELSASGYTALTGYDLQSDAWQTITVTPATPGWDVGDGWTSLKFHAINGDDSTLRFSIDDIVLVPEPATMLLFGLGGLLLRRRK